MDRGDLLSIRYDKRREKREHRKLTEEAGAFSQECQSNWNESVRDKRYSIIHERGEERERQGKTGGNKWRKREEERRWKREGTDRDGEKSRREWLQSG